MRFFNQVSLSTPESVELEFTLAGIGSRVLAVFIDYQLVTIGLALFWFLWSVFGIGLLANLNEGDGNTSAAPTWLLAIGILLNFIIAWGYFIYFEVLWRGQTPGKRIAKIRVVRDDGRPVKLPQAVLRSLLRTIDEILFIGLLMIVFGKREKRIGDWVAGTIVIQDERGDRQQKIYISDAGKQLAAALPEMADLSQLLPDDYAVIREYLLRRGKMADSPRREKSLELARQLRHLIALEAIPENTVADHFLEAVYLAYQDRTGVTDAEPRVDLTRDIE